MKICKKDKKSKELAYINFTAKQNKAFRKKFSLIPKSQIIVFVPHCLRKTSVCRAQEKDSYYICAQCGACKISPISELTKELGYQGLFILKGGRTIIKLIEELKPKAVVGISCFFEGDLAFRTLKDYEIVVQFIPLSKDGCSDTDVDLEEVKKVLKGS
jgi:hypothetical protein